MGSPWWYDLMDHPGKTHEIRQMFVVTCDNKKRNDRRVDFSLFRTFRIIAYLEYRMLEHDTTKASRATARIWLETLLQPLRQRRLW